MRKLRAFDHFTAIVGKGRLALQQIELTDAEQFATRALAINPRHAGALTLFADVALACGDDAAAEDARHPGTGSNVVVHELAHHFGIDDDRLHELGWG